MTRTTRISGALVILLVLSVPSVASAWTGPVGRVPRFHQVRRRRHHLAAGGLQGRRGPAHPDQRGQGPGDRTAGELCGQVPAARPAGQRGPQAGQNREVIGALRAQRQGPGQGEVRQRHLPHGGDRRHRSARQVGQAQDPVRPQQPRPRASGHHLHQRGPGRCRVSRGLPRQAPPQGGVPTLGRHGEPRLLPSRLTRGKDPGERITAAGYDWTSYAENIAFGQLTPRAVVDAWLSSPSHRGSMVNCRYRDIGIGLAHAGKVPYWTQDFGTE